MLLELLSDLGAVLDLLWYLEVVRLELFDFSEHGDEFVAVQDVQFAVLVVQFHQFAVRLEGNVGAFVADVLQGGLAPVLEEVVLGALEVGQATLDG